MNDEQHKPENEAVVLTPAEIREAIQVLTKDSKSAIVSIESNRKTAFDLDTQMKRVYKDLDRPRTGWDRKTTRELALTAYTQSRGFLSTQTLADHKVIKDLGEELDKYVGQANIKFGHLRRQIETIPSPENMQDLLNENWDYKEVKKRIDGLEESKRLARAARAKWLEELCEHKKVYVKADHPTRAEFNEFKSDHAELVHKFNCVINYIVGYTTGKAPETSAHILKAYEHTPKKEATTNEESTGNNSPSKRR